MNIRFFNHDEQDPTIYLGGDYSKNGKKRFKKPKLLAGNEKLFRRTIRRCPYEHTYDSLSVQSPEPGSESLVTANHMLLPRQVLRFLLGTNKYHYFTYLIYQHFNRERSAEFHIVVVRIYQELDLSASFYRHGKDTEGLANFCSYISRQFGLIDPNWEAAVDYLETISPTSNREIVERDIETIWRSNHVPAELDGPHMDGWYMQVQAELKKQAQYRDQDIFNKYYERLNTNEQLPGTRIATIGNATNGMRTSNATQESNRSNSTGGGEEELGMGSVDDSLTCVARLVRSVVERGREEHAKSAKLVARSTRIEQIRPGVTSPMYELGGSFDSAIGGGETSRVTTQSVDDSSVKKLVVGKTASEREKVENANDNEMEI